MTRSQLTLCSLLLVGCSSAPEDGVGGASSNRQPWTPPPPVLAVLERALDELPRFLELDPGTVRVSASATVPLEIAYPSLRTERLEAWKQGSKISSFELPAVNAPLEHSLLGEPAFESSVDLLRARVELAQGPVASLELLLGGARDGGDYSARLHGLVVEPRPGSQTLAAQLQTLGIRRDDCGLQAIHPELGAIYRAGGRPGRLLVTALEGGHRVTAVVQGPLREGFVPWDELAAEVSRRHAENESLDTFVPWLRHAAFGEVDVALGGPLVSPEARAEVEQQLRALLHPEVRPGRFLNEVRRVGRLERSLDVTVDRRALIGAELRDALHAHARAQSQRASQRGLPVLAGTWRWLAWELKRSAEPDFGLALRRAVLPVFEGRLRYASEFTAATPLARRAEVPLAADVLSRDSEQSRWRVRYTDEPELESQPLQQTTVTVTWQQPNPEWQDWRDRCDDYEAQIQASNLWLETTDITVGRDEAVSAINDYFAEYAAFKAGEPPKGTRMERTIPVTIQRYTGTLTRRYAVAISEQEQGTFSLTYPVDLRLKRHEAVPEAKRPAADEHLSPAAAGRAAQRSLDEREPAVVYRRILQQLLRPAIERRLPQETDPADLGQEVAWSQWWLGLELDADLVDLVGDAVALRDTGSPLIPPSQAALAAPSLSALLEAAQQAPSGVGLERAPAPDTRKRPASTPVSFSCVSCSTAYPKGARICLVCQERERARAEATAALRRARAAAKRRLDSLSSAQEQPSEGTADDGLDAAELEVELLTALVSLQRELGQGDQATEALLEELRGDVVRFRRAKASVAHEQAFSRQDRAARRAAAVQQLEACEEQLEHLERTGVDPAQAQGERRATPLKTEGSAR